MKCIGSNTEFIGGKIGPRSQTHSHREDANTASACYTSVEVCLRYSTENERLVEHSFLLAVLGVNVPTEPQMLQTVPRNTRAPGTYHLQLSFGPVLTGTVHVDIQRAYILRRVDTLTGMTFTPSTLQHSNGTSHARGVQSPRTWENLPGVPWLARRNWREGH